MDIIWNNFGIFLMSTRKFPAIQLDNLFTLGREQQAAIFLTRMRNKHMCMNFQTVSPFIALTFPSKFESIHTQQQCFFQCVQNL